MIQLAALALAVATAAQPPRSLSLLVWGDLHGDPSPRLFSWVDSLRREADSRLQPILALDAGDGFFGSDLAFVTAGGSQAKVLNLVQPDAITLGARDFWWNRDRLDTLLASVRVPVTTSNITYALTDKPYGGKDWLLWDFDGLRVGLIGIGDPDLDAADRPSKAYDLRSGEPIERIQASMDALKARQAELIIVFSHAGRDADRSLAQAVPGINLIVGTRDEVPVPAEVAGDAWIVRANGGAAALTRVDLTVTDSGLVLNESSTVPPANLALNPDWKPLFDSLAGLLNARSSVVIDTLKEAWPKTTREAHLGNFLADALRNQAGVEIGLWPASSLRGGLPKGKVTVGDLWKALPPPEQVSVFELPGSDLQRLILHQMIHAKDFLFLSGASCTPDSSAVGGPPLSVWVDGKPLQSSNRYRVAIPLAIRQRIYELTGFSEASAGPTYLERWDRDLIEAYARQNKLRTTLGRVPAMYGVPR